MLSSLLVSRKHHSDEIQLLKKLITIAFLMILGVNIGNWLVLPFKTGITNMRYDVDSDSNLVLNSEQFELGGWIASNTPTNSLIASNFLCSSKQTNDLSNTNFDCRNRNTLVWIAPLARRPVLLEAPSWIPSAPGTNRLSKIVQYIDYAERFANLPGSEIAMQLQELGVTYLVIDKGKTGTTKWEPSANIVFETESYSVLKLVDK
jgi:hypothetical protein